MKKPVKRNKTYTDRLFKRFSQITGVPIKDLMPTKQKNFTNFFGYYDAFSHTAHLTGDKKLDEHEIRHGIQNLIMFPDRSSQLKNQRIKAYRDRRDDWIEPTNIDPEETLETSIKRSPAISREISFSQISKKELYESILRLTKAHGQDATLLLWALPPKKRNATQIIEWEKQMVQKGYLKEKGGMTKKGLQFFRKNLQAATIWKKLKKIRETEKKPA